MYTFITYIATELVGTLKVYISFVLVLLILVENMMSLDGWLSTSNDANNNNNNNGLTLTMDYNCINIGFNTDFAINEEKVGYTYQFNQSLIPKNITNQTLYHGFPRNKKEAIKVMQSIYGDNSVTVRKHTLFDQET